MRDIQLAKTKGYGWRAVEWLMGVFGGVAALLGFFIMFGPEDDYVGLGGDFAWQVGDISSVWMFGLLFGGFGLLAGALFMVIEGRSRISKTSTARGDLLWHTGVFILVNAFVWAQDFALGTGLDYAYLMTIPWGIGLAIHAFLFSRGRSETRMVSEVESAELEKRELQHH